VEERARGEGVKKVVFREREFCWNRFLRKEFQKSAEGNLSL